MDQHRVLLLCQLPLLCEGIQRIIENLGDVELITLDCSDPEAVLSCLADFAPATVLIAREGSDAGAMRLISGVLDHFPDIAVISIEPTANVLRVYTSHTLPANSQQLIGAIRQVKLAPGKRQTPTNSPRRK